MEKIKKKFFYKNKRKLKIYTKYIYSQSKRKSGCLVRKYMCTRPRYVIMSDFY